MRKRKFSWRGLNRCRRETRPSQKPVGSASSLQSESESGSGAQGPSRDEVDNAEEVQSDSPTFVLSVDTAIEVLATSPQPGASRLTVSGLPSTSTSRVQDEPRGSRETEPPKSYLWRDSSVKVPFAELVAASERQGGSRLDPMSRTTLPASAVDVAASERQGGSRLGPMSRTTLPASAVDVAASERQGGSRLGPMSRTTLPASAVDVAASERQGGSRLGPMSRTTLPASALDVPADGGLGRLGSRSRVSTSVSGNTVVPAVQVSHHTSASSQAAAPARGSLEASVRPSVITPSSLVPRATGATPDDEAVSRLSRVSAMSAAGKSLTETIAILSDAAAADAGETETDAFSSLATGKQEEKGSRWSAALGAGDTMVQTRETPADQSRTQHSRSGFDTKSVPSSSRGARTMLGMGDQAAPGKHPSAVSSASRASQGAFPKRDEAAPVRAQHSTPLAMQTVRTPERSNTSAAPRKQKSSVFSMKRGVQHGPAVSGSLEKRSLIEYVDKILPEGLRRLLLQLPNHRDLGGLSLCARTLEQHQRLSSALLHLQALEAKARAQAAREARQREAKSVQISPRSRWSKWRRGLMLPFGLTPPRPPPRPLPPLPPDHRPNLHSVGEHMRVALEQGLGPGQPLYDPRWAGDACRILAAHITRSAEKWDLNLNRYKLACVVRIVQKLNQGLTSHLSVMWDPACDAYCSRVYEADSFLAHALLMLVYLD